MNYFVVQAKANKKPIIYIDMNGEIFFNEKKQAIDFAYEKYKKFNNQYCFFIIPTQFLNQVKSMDIGSPNWQLGQNFFQIGAI